MTAPVWSADPTFLPWKRSRSPTRALMTTTSWYQDGSAVVSGHRPKTAVLSWHTRLGERGRNREQSSGTSPNRRGNPPSESDRASGRRDLDAAVPPAAGARELLGDAGHPGPDARRGAPAHRPLRPGRPGSRHRRDARPLPTGGGRAARPPRPVRVAWVPRRDAELPWDVRVRGPVRAGRGRDQRRGRHGR